MLDKLLVFLLHEPALVVDLFEIVAKSSNDAQARPTGQR
jgi:hypothetical protein